MSHLPLSAELQLQLGIPELPCADVAATRAWWCALLGFAVNHEDAGIAVLDREAVRVLLVARTPERPGPGACYLYVRDADALHTELTARGARPDGPPITRPWGLREFELRDSAGNRITCGQPIE